MRIETKIAKIPKADFIFTEYVDELLAKKSLLDVYWAFR